MARPTAVLLHGVGLDRSVWEPLTDLIGGRYDVVALDLPGHGSRPPVSAGITLSDLADGVTESIPAGAHVVGFSSAHWSPSTSPFTAQAWFGP